jgi:hypothetical protein
MAEEIAAQRPSGVTQLPVGMGAMALGVLSQSTGSVLLDAGIGALVGYAVAPKKERAGYVAGGAAATAVAGVLGLAGLLVYRYYRR